MGSQDSLTVTGSRAVATGPETTLAVVIPAFNEEGAVRSTVTEVSRVLVAAGISHEIVVVNDGSTDNTRAEATASGARVIHFAENVGYGHALKAGIAATNSTFVAILDADGTYPPEVLPQMLDLALASDMVVGDRGAAMSNVPLLRRPAKWIWLSRTWAFTAPVKGSRPPGLCAVTHSRTG